MRRAGVVVSDLGANVMVPEAEVEAAVAEVEAEGR